MPDDPTVQSKAAAGLLNLANVVTFGRLCAVPLAFWLVVAHRIGDAFWLFAAAGLSDAVDGWLARRFGGNAVGALMDPIADKALLVTMYITLASIGLLPGWLAVLVVFRDLVIVGGVLVLALLDQRIEIRPLLLSKLNTVLQILLIGLALLRAGGAPVPRDVIDVLTALVVLTTLASGGGYVLLAAKGWAT